MVSDKKKIQVNNLSDDEISKIDAQEAPKFLLRCMLHLSKNGIFTYKDLVIFMKEHCTDDRFYKGSGIRCKDNISRYWGYAKSKNHNARIPNFESYFTILN